MASSFSVKTRTQNIENFKCENYDLVIIGGGITGAGMARDAASRGMKVALVEIMILPREPVHVLASLSMAEFAI